MKVINFILSMIEGRRCCDCGNIVWPGQQSYISYSSIHRECHRKSMREFLAKHPDMAGEFAKELINATTT